MAISTYNIVEISTSSVVASITVETVALKIVSYRVTSTKNLQRFSKLITNFKLRNWAAILSFVQQFKNKYSLVKVS